jgi:hypothetical protein
VIHTRSPTTEADLADLIEPMVRSQLGELCGGVEEIDILPITDPDEHHRLQQASWDREYEAKQERIRESTQPREVLP